MLTYKLEDAQEHLAELASKTQAGTITMKRIPYRLGHMFAHLNKAWHLRDAINDMNEEQLLSAGHFPADLEPI